MQHHPAAASAADLRPAHSLSSSSRLMLMLLLLLLLLLLPLLRLLLMLLMCGRTAGGVRDLLNHLCWSLFSPLGWYGRGKRFNQTPPQVRARLWCQRSVKPPPPGAFASRRQRC